MNKEIFVIFILVIAIFGCGEQVRQVKPLSELKSEDKSENYTPQKKWDNSMISKVPEGDKTGWYISKKEYWIDTMREEKHKYNPFPPTDMGKTYYPNFTFHFPEDISKLKNPEKDIKVFVKSLDQQPIKWIFPVNDTKLFGDQRIEVKNIKESSAKYQYYIIDINDNESLKEQNANIENQLAIDIQQIGNVLISQISHYKIRNHSDMKYAKTEITIYDLLGKKIASLIRDGAIANAKVSKNLKYLSQTYGGQVTEDSKLPSGASIYNIVSKKYLWKYETDEKCLSAQIPNDENYGTISIKDNCNSRFNNDTLVVVDLEHETSYLFSGYTSEMASIKFDDFDSRAISYYSNKVAGEIISIEWNNFFREIDFFNKK